MKKNNSPNSQEDKLDYLLSVLKSENKEYKNMNLGTTLEEKKYYFRALRNIRKPGKIYGNFIKVQDQFLKKEAKGKGIIKLSDMQTVKEQYGSANRHAEKLSVWQGDITRIAAGAVVNAANAQMLGCFIPGHNCIDNCINTAAGIQLREECNIYMEKRKAECGKNYEEPTGRAVITKGYNMPAENVIHTVGPIVNSKVTESLREDLRKCYRSVLDCAVENNVRTIAFCCISTGEFHFPNEEAAAIAVNTVTKYLDDFESKFDRIIFNVFKDTDRDIYKKILS